MDKVITFLLRDDGSRTEDSSEAVRAVVETYDGNTLVKREYLSKVPSKKKDA